jgi:hypothetical protein
MSYEWPVVVLVVVFVAIFVGFGFVSAAQNTSDVPLAATQPQSVGQSVR